MIGQQDLIDTFESLDILPSFIILVGQVGSGKKTFIREVLNKRLTTVYAEDNSVASIREIINTANMIHNALFVFCDADTMSVSAQNALLKVVEECPNNNHFIMTLADENNVLETIRSRAFIYHTESYSQEDIEEYAIHAVSNLEDDAELLGVYVELCDTPGEVNMLTQMNAEYFYDYVQKVIDNIATVSGSNSFKIAENIAFKDESDKYDLKLFWKAFISCCLNRCGYCDKEDILKYARGSQITSRALRDLRIKGINKPALFDHWILDIRQEWM